MNVGNAIVTHAILNQDVESFEGVNADSPALFVMEDRRAWRWILNHWNRHRVPPTEEVFADFFPDYVLSEESYTAEELVSLAEEKHFGYEFNEMVVKLNDATEADNLPLALSIIQKFNKTPRTVAKPFKILSLNDLRNLKNPEPLIEGLLDVGTVNMLNGYRGTGKSFIAIDWACCVAAGISWRNHDVKQGKVLYIAAEGGHGLLKRIDAWEKANTKIPDGMFEIVIKPVQIHDPEQFMYLKNAILDNEYLLVLIDTQARCSVGLEENSAKDMGLFVDNLFKLKDACEESNTTILDIHHTGYQNGRARGSTALEGALDSVFTVECPGKDHPKPYQSVVLINTKQKDRAEHQPINMKLQVVHGSQSCVLVDGPEVDTDAGTGRNKVVDFLIENPRSTQAEIVKGTELDKSTVSRILGNDEFMKDKGRPARYQFVALQQVAQQRTQILT